MGPMWPMAPSLLTFAGLSPGSHLAPFVLLTFSHLYGLCFVLPSVIGLRPLHFLIPLLGPSPDTVAPVFSLVSA